MRAMRVLVEFHGVHRAITRVNELEVSIDSDSRVSDLLARVEDAFPGLHLGGGDIMISINDRVSSLDRSLRPRDRVSFLPHIGGG